MSRDKWNLIKQSKHFYIATYRNVCLVLGFSLALSMVLLICIYYVYFNRSEHQFYATDGVTPPKLLLSMDEANNTAYPLLANDQAVDDLTRALPE